MLEGVSPTAAWCCNDFVSLMESSSWVGESDGTDMRNDGNVYSMC